MKTDLMPKNGNSKSVTLPMGRDSPENPNGAKNQSHCRIQYHAFLEKITNYTFPKPT